MLNFSSTIDGGLDRSTPRQTPPEIGRRRLLAAWLFLLAMVLLLPALQAQEHPFLERGASREALSSVDSVNLSSGAGVLRIPIGPRLPIGGGLTFGLDLFYNSKIWDTESSRYADPILGQLPISFPSRKSSAGLGWTLTLGQLHRPNSAPLNVSPDFWLYIDPSGGNHFFYPSLHDGDSSGPLVWYSRDSSYLRMRRVGAEYHVEMSSGEIHIFDNGSQPRLKQIINRYVDSGSVNVVDVTYSSAGGLDVVTATDSHGRVWKIHSRDVVIDYPGPDPPPAEERTIAVVEKVEVPAVGGAAGALATYDFTYVDAGLVPGCAWGIFRESDRKTLPLLKLIELPEVDGERLSWSFDYTDDDADTSDDAANYNQCIQGTVHTTTLPSGGQIRWDFAAFEIRPHCNTAIPAENRFRFFWNKSAALREREYVDVDGSSLATWKYSYWESEPPANPGSSLIRCQSGEGPPASETLTVREITPTGDVIFHPFMIWPFPSTPGSEFASEHGASSADYFLPHIRTGIEPRVPHHFNPEFFDTVAPAEDSEGRFLSKAVFDCFTSINDCVPFSVTYVRFANQEPYEYFTGHTTDRNDRLESERTVYFNAAGESHEVITESSRFDGLGNFRQVETSSSFPGEPTRKMVRDYNVGLGVIYDFGDPNYVMLGEDQPWILGTYSLTEHSKTDDGGTSEGRRVETLFDTTNGFMLRTRVLAATGAIASIGRAANDILTVHTPDSAGNVASVSTYGGDQQNNLSLDALEDLNPGSGWEYRRSMSYAGGHLEKEEQIGRHGGSLVITDLDVDLNSGLPTTSRDATGLATTFAYDALGRLIELNPPSDASTTAVYTAATATEGENIVLRQASSDGIFEQRFVQDGFGRHVLEEVKYPGDEWAVSEFTYGPNGFLAEASTTHWRGDEPAGATLYQDYDPMGRPLTTIYPDMSRTTLAVDREHRFETFFKVAGVGGEIETSTRVKRESGGLVLAVEEPSDAGQWVTTSYAYDVGDRLARVEIPRSGAPSQVRTFSYDNRGFLHGETHPENGTVTHASFDTAGNPGSRSDAEFALTFDYDAFGRLIRTWDTGGAESRLLEEHFYSRANRDGGTDRALGKVVMAKRYNYLGGGEPVIVTETYAYDDDQGRLSELRTRSNTGFDVGQVFSYDGRGRLESHGYPRQDVLPGSAGPDRTVSFSYDLGRLVGVDSASGASSATIVESMEYRPQGLVGSRLHGNGVKDLLFVESGMARPVAMRTLGVAGNADWISGTFEYDGAGNIKQIGDQQQFWYDEISRLAKSEVDGTVETYAYDRFGNLQNLGGQTLSVDGATNRLTGSYSYDGAGNLLSDGVQSFTYDSLNMPSTRTVGGETTRYLYSVGGERVAVIEPNGDERWTVRDPQMRLLREYTRAPLSRWIAERDYIYADRLVASRGLAGGSRPALRRHYHSDHLGSPRLISDGDGRKVSGHTYLPFGEEIPDVDNPSVDSEILKFTGHERDAANLDYMRARFYSPVAGRFLGVDPVLGEVENPQSWNRYSYVRNNPMLYVDPDGKTPQRGIVPQGQRDPKRQVSPAEVEEAFNYNKYALNDGKRHSCEYCDKTVSTESPRTGKDSAQIEHVKSHAKGGGSVAENIVVVCGECNPKKGAKDLGTQTTKTTWAPPKPNSHVQGIMKKMGLLGTIITLGGVANSASAGEHPVKLLIDFLPDGDAGGHSPSDMDTTTPPTYNPEDDWAKRPQ